MLAEKEKMEKVKELSGGLLDFLYEEGNPYTEIVITMEGVEVKQSIGMEKFELRD